MSSNQANNQPPESDIERQGREVREAWTALLGALRFTPPGRFLFWTLDRIEALLEALEAQHNRE